MVAITDILGKRQVNQPVDQLLDIHLVVGSVEIDIQHGIYRLNVY